MDSMGSQSTATMMASSVTIEGVTLAEALENFDPIEVVEYLEERIGTDDLLNLLDDIDVRDFAKTKLGLVEVES